MSTTSIRQKKNRGIATDNYAEVTPYSYQRPAEYLTLPEVLESEQKIVGLLGIEYGNANYISFRCTGAYTVDWGDGTSNDYASLAYAMHNYDYSSISGATTVEGYKQVIVTITPQSGQNITSCDFYIQSHSALSTQASVLRWLEFRLSLPNATSIYFGHSGTLPSNKKLRSLRRIELLSSASSVTGGASGNSCFAAGLSNLEYVYFGPSVGTFTGGYMFLNCLKLKKIDGLKISGSNAQTFANCQSIEDLSNIETTNIQDLNSTFLNCYKLKSLPAILNHHPTNGTSISSIFDGCSSLRRIPFIDTKNIQTFTYACRSMYMLEEAPNWNTIAGITFTGMFDGCRALKDIPNYNTPNATTFNGLFANCSVLFRAPMMDTSKVTNMQDMFKNCSALEEVPLYDTSKVTNTSTMFLNCISLSKIPNFDLAACTNTNGMFGDCKSLSTVNITNTPVLTNAGGMFGGCINLESIGEIDFSKITTSVSNSASTTYYGLFYNCTSLRTLPASFANINPALTDGGAMFYNCSALETIPLINTSAWTKQKTDIYNHGFLNGAISVSTIPALNFSNIADASNMYVDALGLSRNQSYGLKFSHTYSSTARLSKAALEEIFTNLGKPATSQTITITGVLGAQVNPIVSKTSCGTTSGSTTISQSNTSNLVIGQLVTGTGISTGRSVTLQGTADTVTLAGHGLPNGRRVSFSAITTTTGISTYTYYYVINATTDTFQLATTVGGSAIDLVNDGSGTVLYPTYITGITTNTNFTVDVPASATGTVTLVARNLDTSLATMKFWSVTG